MLTSNIFPRRSALRKVPFLLPFLLPFLVFLIHVAFAQSQLGTGAIGGVVQDSSAAVVAGAEVRISSTETGLIRALVSGAAGDFLAPVLPPGKYKILAKKPGFTSLDV